MQILVDKRTDRSINSPLIDHILWWKTTIDGRSLIDPYLATVYHMLQMRNWMTSVSNLITKICSSSFNREAGRSLFIAEWRTDENGSGINTSKVHMHIVHRACVGIVIIACRNISHWFMNIFCIFLLFVRRFLSI